MPSNPTAPAAWSLTFAYDGSNVHLERKERLRMVVPGSDPTEGYEGNTGYWIELRDASGKVVYRTILHNPMPQYHEVHDRSGRPTHVPVKECKGSFTVVVPALPQTSTIVFFGTDQPPVEPIGSRVAEQARPATPRIGTGAAREMTASLLEGGQP
jgi:hypothetical protein